jgi:hypothetical protein
VAGGHLDGAWWPYSRDLAAELRILVDHFPVANGHIDRVVYSRPDWDTSPRKVQVSRGLMKTGSFPSDDSHLLVLGLSTRRQLELLVVPPSTDAETAEELMAGAASASNRSTGSELLATADRGRALVSGALQRDDERHDEYDDPDRGGEG